MNTKEIAQALSGCDYGSPDYMPKQITEAARAAGIVIVTGASDDLIDLYGAIRDEIGASEFRVHPFGLLPNLETLLDSRNANKIREYFAAEPLAMAVKPIFDQDQKTWKYETAIPHETFDVMEDGEVYATGIVFNLSDVGKCKIGNDLLMRVARSMAIASNPNIDPDSVQPGPRGTTTTSKRWEGFSHMAQAAIVEVMRDINAGQPSNRQEGHNHGS